MKLLEPQLRGNLIPKLLDLLNSRYLLVGSTLHLIHNNLNHPYPSMAINLGSSPMGKEKSIMLQH